MSTEEEIGWFFIKYFIILPSVIIVLILIIRSVFRINEIAGYLHRLADRLAPELPKVVSPQPKNPLQSQCDFCRRPVPNSELTPTSSGLMACLVCLKVGTATKLKSSKDNNL
jgi:hypothetical protein